MQGEKHSFLGFLSSTRSSGWRKFFSFNVSRVALVLIVSLENLTRWWFVPPRGMSLWGFKFGESFDELRYANWNCEQQAKRDEFGKYQWKITMNHTWDGALGSIIVAAKAVMHWIKYGAPYTSLKFDGALWAWSHPNRSLSRIDIWWWKLKIDYWWITIGPCSSLPPSLALPSMLHSPHCHQWFACATAGLLTSPPSWPRVFWGPDLWTEKVNGSQGKCTIEAKWRCG